ncbi:hypothetical protein EI74_0028 [Mycoplasma testudineum]|uniref:Pullulanase n=1 Tax=Mycoplasma testudineum TaxID=244584 RepID=A0A4R6IJC5_9MOLU|nr:hypothetical protein [Mycoplasma testudineum]OYD26433.1 hypothetical protein CG473_03950 [Mycoplasma testudineum]TDO22122.1 hypothetical protein EI74_0028 [Mycoplasma testudineum]
MLAPSQIRKLLPKAIIYGEAWNFTDLPDGDSPVKPETGLNTYISSGKLTGLGYFNDVIREYVKGDTGHNQAFQQGYLQGELKNTSFVRAAIIAGIKNFIQDRTKEGELYSDIVASENDIFAIEPWEAIQYLSIHDGHTLWDKINLSVFRKHGQTDEDFLRFKLSIMKQAYAILFTSQGRIVLHGGDEFGRTKPLTYGDNNPDRSAAGEHTILFKDVNPVESKYSENTYNASDDSNKIRWNRLDSSFENGIFKDMSDYVAGLINLRKKIYALRMESATEINDNLRFLNEIDSKPIINFSGYNDPNLDSLTIKFINAPTAAYNKTFYIAGENNDSFSNEMLTKTVSIDKNGNGTLIFDRNELDKIYKKRGEWGRPDAFNFKLVQNIGSWDSIDGSYLGDGNTTIPIDSLLKDKSAIVDLSKPNYVASNPDNAPITGLIQLKIAYPDINSEFSDVFIAMNPSNDEQNLAIKFDKSWEVLVDEQNAGTTKLDKYNVEDPNFKIRANQFLLVAKRK